jgi:AraC family transcriptional regulator
MKGPQRYNFTGLPHRSESVGGFAVARWSQCAAPLEGEHFHAEAHFIFIISGSYQSTAKGQSSDLGTQLIYNPAQLSHSDRLETGEGCFLTISLSAPFYELLSDVGLPSSSIQLPKTRSQLAIRRVSKALSSPVTDQLLLESHCMELVEHCSALSVADEPRTGWLGRAREAISELSEVPASIVQLSHDAGVHPVHFTRSFKRAFGCTPGELRCARRVSVAADMLTTSRRALVEIAFECGYSDQSHFSNEFRRWVGFTPHRFRQLTAG